MKMILRWIDPVVACRWPSCSRWVLALVIVASLFALPTHQTYAEDCTGCGDKHRILVLIGSDEDDPFWSLFAEFMGVAADQLGLELQFRFADGSLKAMSSHMRVECERKKKPACIVMQSFKRGGLKFLHTANSYQVPVFLINSGLTSEQRAKAGEPRSQLKYWVGEMLPDDYGAGFQLANALIDAAKKDPSRLGPDGRVHLIALGGTVSHTASVQRTAGLMDAVEARRDEVVLNQLVAADWKKGFARNRCRFLHRRYPQASAVWTANDQMALGAIEGLRDLKLVPGKDVVVGGVDATRQAMTAIKEGTLAATVGGHFQEGGWVAVIIHDLLNGLDLSKIPMHYASPMKLVTAENVAAYQASLQKSEWDRINFKQYSRLHRPKSDGYQFRFELADRSVDTSMQIGKEQQSVEKPARNE
ncbi:ABC-type sugar transport system substrate-binding protein [Rhodopirellula rubra]|uniref:ABC-type sugar transport system substrate-binding protein n=1 Tax=Aporhodopirellula rubra TaxID=980271 RepID=A0A7W5DZ72_9BACT|nr:ABC transporter substrate-binding protein [Aporhodopirellula rubra]MBB3206899.1 ABC-type sugar transport system substrate-binding protein [Aporhodopirellula rubra]